MLAAEWTSDLIANPCDPEAVPLDRRGYRRSQTRCAVGRPVSHARLNGAYNQYHAPCRHPTR
jgi:hypothetical protein